MQKNSVSTKKTYLFLVVIYNIILNSNFGIYAQNLTQYVDPLIGSGSHGHVFVGASVPFGAVQPGPNNIYKGWDWCSGYNYSDSLIIGFSQLHLSGTGIGDLGDVLIMPVFGEVIIPEKGREEYPHNGYLSSFKHSNEVVKAGYYSVKLDNDIKVELTASERVAFHKYCFPKENNNHLIIDLKEGINDNSTDTYLEQVDDYTIKGYRFSSGWNKKQQVYFSIKSSVKINNFTIYNDNLKIKGNKIKGTSLKGVLTFNKGNLVQLKVGISPVNTENALANIEAEIPHWDFDKVVKEADKKWNKALENIMIETDDVAVKRVFYTSLFHSMIHPSLFNDNNSHYRGANNKVYTNSSFQYYSIFSTWDTYRAEHPLLLFAAPDRINDIINSMLAIYNEQDYLPIWHLNGWETGTMVGISSLQIVAEAYLKGFKGFNTEAAFSALKKTALSDLRGLNYLQKFQPVPSDMKIDHPVAQAMEFSISDRSIALMAKELGKTEDYKYFNKRAENYKLYFDKQSGFFRGKMPDGSWNPIFNPIKSTRPWSSDYAEGNSWQYLWLVPHDVNGLKSLMGGEEGFIKRLDTFFSMQDTSSGEVLIDLTGAIGQYAHGNEPSHHIAYLYAYAGQQWKTAEKVNYIMNEFYHDKPDGIIGNEDCGQMSAWYVFSAMGFYPVYPADGIYVIGSPILDKVSINVGNNKHFSVTAIHASKENMYIQSAELNGTPFNLSYITHKEIMNGGTLVFKMGNKPNKNWAAGKECQPPSLTEK